MTRLQKLKNKIKHVQREPTETDIGGTVTDVLRVLLESVEFLLDKEIDAETPNGL